MRRATTYAAGCATCHGAMAQGTTANADGSYMFDGGTYSYPAPGLDTEMGNLASDPDWNAALLAVAARSDMDNGGLELCAPMPLAQRRRDRRVVVDARLRRHLRVSDDAAADVK
jgi:hypothetical protein